MQNMWAKNSQIYSLSVVHNCDFVLLDTRD